MNNKKKLDYSDILIVPSKSDISSRSEVSLISEISFPNSKSVWKGVPIVAANMDGVGTFSIASKLADHKMLTFLTKFKTYNQWKSFLSDKSEDFKNYVGVSSGISDKDICNAAKIFKDFNLSWFCIDVANGYSSSFTKAISKARSMLGDKAIIVAGNVVTGEMSKEIILSGADVVKVGIGPGSACSTRIKTGIGYPQFSAVLECSEAVDPLGGLVMADGGCTCPGDISKSFVAGASLSMLGGMFAGHDEGEGEIIEKMFLSNQIDPISGEAMVETKKFVRFYGMSSKRAQETHGSGLATYRASEGHDLEIPYKGSVEGTLLDMLGGIRSTCSYIGARTIDEIHSRSKYVTVNRQFNTRFLS